MDDATLGKFLRYCTGADILLTEEIEVTFIDAAWLVDAKLPRLMHLRTTVFLL